MFYKSKITQSKRLRRIAGPLGLIDVRLTEKKLQNMKKGFFAYSSEPNYSGETIEDAIVKINDSYKGIAEIESWVSMKISGKLIISEILNKIDDCDFFCADLTGLNNNVLFELGYAISKKKPTWLIIDTSNESSNKKFHELNFFTTIGYCSYNNSADLINSFSKEKTYEANDNIFDSLTDNINLNQGENALFYIKGQIDTNYSQDIINEIEYLKLPYILDDPLETKVQPLSWYLEKIFTVPAILVEFSSTHRVGFDLHNAKCAFISGLSLGFGLELLMIAEKPHPTPLDYRELLKKHTNRNECKNNVKPYLNSIHNDIAELLVKKRSRKAKRKQISNLQKVNFGEYIAEHETDNIYDYYVETSHYQNLIKGEHNIVIGRKGTGKTATLYYLEQTLQNDVRNHVCLIKPVNFEIEGLLALNKNFKDEFERGYMIEAIWKFLIYTEIAKSLYIEIKKKNLYSLSDHESDFIEFVSNNSNIILTDFSTRLEQEIEKLVQIKTESQGAYKIRISEILHEEILKELSSHIKKNMRPKGKLVVLIDNLDKSWRKNSNLVVLSKYILGLLGVVGRIAKEFRGKKVENIKFTFHLTLFLRSDIFKYIMRSAREPDKIEYSRLLWHDPEVLYRLIELRFEQLSDADVFADDIWEKYFVDYIDDQSTKEFIISSIFPRPRDIIFFLTSAKNIAISRGHTTVQKDDILSAQKDYSNWVFKSILVENGITITQMQDFMYNLMGEGPILTKDEIIGFAKKSKIDLNSEEQITKFIDHLVSLTIIGREIKDFEFEFEYEFDSDIKLKALANKMKTSRYKIHNALLPYLEINN